MLPNIEVLTPALDDYALLDSGHGEKLERFGGRVLRRGEPKAWWAPALGKPVWQEAAASHDDASGNWAFRDPAARQPWELRLEALRLQMRLTHNSKHVGIFPEQEPHWRRITRLGQRARSAGGEPPRLLNLFGYTGVASLVAAAAGFQVTHVDASKPALEWARRNQALSGLEARPIRWILEDALLYCQREQRRGSRYEAILLDPPSFGRGPRKQLWKVERDLPALLALCGQLLSERPLLLLLTCYSVEASALSMWNLLRDVAPKTSGQLTCGELATPHSNHPRLLPLSLWAAWQQD